MATEKKASQRDMALISILERMADQLTQQDQRIEEISNRQIESSAAQDRRIEEIANLQRELLSTHDQRSEDMTKRQHELSSTLDRLALRQNLWQQNTGPSIEKLNQDFQRYRSDMLGIVNEQDRITDDMKEMTKRQGSLAMAQESIDMTLTRLAEWSAAVERSMREHYEYTIRQADVFPRLTAEATRSNEKLHMDTEKRLEETHKAELKKTDELRLETVKLHMDSEKRLGETHKEQLKKIDELRSETIHRLLALDGIESALQILLKRTEPPEKKPFWIKRVFRSISLFFKKIYRKVSRRLK